MSFRICAPATVTSDVSASKVGVGMTVVTPPQTNDACTEERRQLTTERGGKGGRTLLVSVKLQQCTEQEEMRGIDENGSAARTT